MPDPDPSHKPGPGPDEAARRVATAAVIVVAAVVGILLVALGPDRSASSDAVVAAATTPTIVTTAPVATSAPVAVTTTGSPAKSTPPPSTTTNTTATTTTVDPGTLAQTDEKPTATGAQFDAGAQGLWQAIVQDDPSLALPFFFPKSAYLQVKAISDPAGDYDHRLVANYEQDIHSLHAQLGDAASRAQLTGLSVPNDQAQWITPGVEYNKGSYWRVYGSTLTYTVDGQTHSFPVTSLISWRGQWYVVHLGAIR